MIRDIQDFACVLSEAPPVLMLLGPVSAWCVLDCLQKCLRVESHLMLQPRTELIQDVVSEIYSQLPAEARKLADRGWHPKQSRSTLG